MCLCTCKGTCRRLSYISLSKMVWVIRVVAVLFALSLEECRGASVKSLLWSLQETMEERESLHQASALKSFKSFSCTSREDGLYPDLASGCSLYYRCLDGAVYSYSCPVGQVLTYGSDECRPSSEASCPKVPPSTPPCINQSDGFYPHYSQNCRAYYRCQNKSMSGGWWCEDGSVWDMSTGSCMSGGDHSCSPPSCWGLPDGPHPSPASSCNAYFICKNGIRTDHVCPYHTIFDYYHKKCMPDTSSVCYEQACEGRINGLHSVPNAPCHVYLRCFNGALVGLEACPHNHIFDGQECTLANNFSCWEGNQGSCQGDRDGFHVAPNSDCRGFFYCRYQQLIRSFRCSQGLAFNGQECVKSDSFVCNALSNVPNCSNKINGYYTVEKSSCKSFYLCQGGIPVSDHTCPGNNLFDGEQCVDPAVHQCTDYVIQQQHSNLTNRVTRSY